MFNFSPCNLSQTISIMDLYITNITHFIYNFSCKTQLWLSKHCEVFWSHLSCLKTLVIRHVVEAYNGCNHAWWTYFNNAFRKYLQYNTGFRFYLRLKTEVNCTCCTGINEVIQKINKVESNEALPNISDPLYRNQLVSSEGVPPRKPKAQFYMNNCYINYIIYYILHYTPCCWIKPALI